MYFSVTKINNYQEYISGISAKAVTLAQVCLNKSDESDKSDEFPTMYPAY